jgi:hypothetical protein
MVTVKLLLMILAIVCLLLAAINVSSPRFNLLAAGLFLWALATVVTV